MLVMVPANYSDKIARLEALRQPINLWRETQGELTDSQLAAARNDPLVKLIYGPYVAGETPKYIAEAEEGKRIK